MFKNMATYYVQKHSNLAMSNLTGMAIVVHGARQKYLISQTKSGIFLHFLLEWELFTFFDMSFFTNFFDMENLLYREWQF